MIWTWWMDRCLVLSEGMEYIDPEIVGPAIHSCAMETLRARREELRQYELESYAALGKKLSAALQDISIFEANARPGHPVVVEVSVLEWAAEPLFSWVEK